MDIKPESPVIDFVVQTALKYLNLSKVVLFGSRARGDARERSDFDFAIFANNVTQDSRARVLLDIDENPVTLLGIDVIFWNDSLNIDLKEKILKEGIIVYDNTGIRQNSDKSS